MKMTDQIYNKLAFNGYHVVYWNHETRLCESQSFPTYASVMERGWGTGQKCFPTPEEFAEALFDVYGDCVGGISDNNQNVLYDNMETMFELSNEHKW
jgi:hypothetical protein